MLKLPNLVHNIKRWWHESVINNMTFQPEIVNKSKHMAKSFSADS